MLKETGRVALFSTAAGVAAVHAFRLSWSLFLEYMTSPTFGGDVADVLCNYESLYAFFEGGFNPSVLVEMYGKLLGSRLAYRFTECAVSAACAFSPSPFFQGAVVFHYLYPTVQHYRFGRCWLTRLLRLIASWVVPRVFRPAKIDFSDDPDGAYLQNPPPPMAAVSSEAIQRFRSRLNAGGTTNEGGSSAARRGAAVGVGDSVRQQVKASTENDVKFYAKEEAVFEAMPDVCAATLRYYVYSYKCAPFKTILQAAFIPDFSRVLVEFGQWAVIFSEERRKKTSHWRILKRFLADQSATFVQVVLSYMIRYVGATVAMKCFSEPTGGSIFWTESMLYFVVAMPILSSSMATRFAVLNYLDKKFPATSEDIEEDCRERAEVEEAAARSDAWTRMAFDNTNKNRGSGSSTGASPNSNNNNNNNNFGNGSGIVDFYAVLQVPEKSTQAEIKKSYRQLALKNHPDRVGRDGPAQCVARERMAVINEAYDTLMDSRKKAQYDARRRVASAPNMMEKLENMSTPKLAGLTVSLFTLLGVAGYAHFAATFQRMTACGCVPLMLFGGM